MTIEKPLSDYERFVYQVSVFKSIPIWILCIASAALYITRYAVGGWGFLYLQEAKGFTTITAGTIMAINTVAAVVGSVAYGFCSDKVFGGRRPPTTLIWGVLQLVGLWGMFLAPFTQYWLVAASFALFGFSVGGMLLGLSGLFAVDIVSRHASGAVMGFIGIFSYAAAALQENISGRLIERHMEVIDGVNHYDFSTPIVFWISASVVALCLSCTLWNARTS